MSVERAVPSVEIAEAAINAFKHTVTSELEARGQAKKRMIEQVKLVNGEQK
jgi:hypothetical protein